ncbi:MAG: twin-arginine translocation signal domain-containing protein [Firmicutes bacterium]|nr:twin-arginine translocation signal domain-containing protein [Bacillota bacterium]
MEKNPAKEENILNGENVEENQWSRRQFLVGTTALGVAGAVTLFGRQSLVDAARGIFGSPVQSGTVHLYAYDYYYIPNYMTWRVGDRMDVIFQNQSHTHWHEWTMGRHVNEAYFQAFGNLPADAWAVDFWDGVHVTLSHPYEVDNFVPNRAIVTYEGPKALYNIQTGGDFSPTLKPGGSLHISFTVPNKPGIWDYGCFVQEYIHYRTGMRGKVRILPA